MKSGIFRSFTLFCTVFLICACVLVSPILSSAPAWAYQVDNDGGRIERASDGGGNRKDGFVEHLERAWNDIWKGAASGAAAGAPFGKPGEGAAAGAIGKTVDGCLNCHPVTKKDMDGMQ
jgi:hypothetical protein